jgi:biopolymer transport protein ExbB/TolQ
VTTACGLLVAIPSVVFYNYCVHKIRNLAKETDLAVYELVAWLSERKEPPMWNGSRTPPTKEPEFR